MNEVLRYLLVSALSLSALYLVYAAFLSRDTFFVTNRIYLVASAILSLIIPLIPFGEWIAEKWPPLAVMLGEVVITPGEVLNATQAHFDWITVTAVVYLTGVAIFFFRFLFQLAQLVILIRKVKIRKENGLKIVFVDRGYSPFSFFNYLFIRNEDLSEDRLSTVIRHERVHIYQGHSADLIIMELLTIIQWFNPFAWLLQRSVRAVHEYLADEGVLRGGTIREEYRRLIFAQTLGIQVNDLTHSFNVSLIKQRVIMMTKEKSAGWTVIKTFLAVPVLLVVVLYLSAGTSYSSFGQTAGSKASQTVVSTNDKEQVYKEVDKMPEYPGGMEAMISFLVKNIKYPEQAKKDSVTGKVIVNFIVERDGRVTNAKVVKGIGSGCDEEAIRVVSLMPAWKPGELHGKTVRVIVNLPIKFALN